MGCRYLTGSGLLEPQHDRHNGLAAIIKRWPELPEAVKAQIVAMVQAAGRIAWTAPNPSTNATTENAAEAEGSDY